MTNAFETIDSKNKTIYLSKERWRHIIQEHPSTSGKLEEIQSAIEKPTMIKISKYDDSVLWYFTHNKKLKRYLMVSVKYLNGEGFVITAFNTRRIP